MTKTIKKMISVIVSFVMVMAMSATVFAAGYTITINKKDSTDKSKHTYEVYQIFSGDVAADGKLYNIDWGSHVDTTDEAALLAAVSGANALNTTCSDVDDVIAALKELEKDSAPLDGFATVIGDEDDGFLKATTYTAVLNGGADPAETSTSVTVSAPGYYLIKDTITTAGEYNTISKFMLKVVNDPTTITVTSKEEIPTLDKVIESCSAADSVITADQKANTASVGDDITFKLTSKVPDLREKGYTDKYCFVMNDTMSAGLTYKGDANVTVKMGTSTIAATDYTINSSAANGTLQIVFDPEKMLTWGTTAATVGQDITVTYVATLNDNAVITDAGNPNTANLVYSNDPYQTYSGDVPTDNEPHGTTPDSTTVTYTTQARLFKVDKNNPTRGLATAEFDLEGLSGRMVVTTSKSAVADAAGTYWLLKDGTYTTDAPDGTHDNLYDSTTTKYKMVESTTTATMAATATALSITVGDDGIIDLSRLGAGTYTLTETAAPQGYVLDDTPRDLVISCTFNAQNKPVWTYNFDGTDITPTAAGGIATAVVGNEKPSDLPITGGMGTTFFYVAGSILVAAGAALIVFKKKTEAGENK